MPRVQVDDVAVVYVPVLYPGETEPRPLADWLPLVNEEDVPA